MMTNPSRSFGIAPLLVALASSACAATVIVPVIWGGDRVGLGEIRFSAVPEPPAWAFDLGGIIAAGVAVLHRGTPRSRLIHELP